MKVSLLVTTYEAPRLLALTLAGVARQSFGEWECLICDDGSGAGTKEVVAGFARVAGRPVRHVWQEHRGYRKAAVVNRGLQEARGEYCVFLDGDCIPHRHYLRDHVSAAEPACYCVGRRAELREGYSAGLTPAWVRSGAWDGPWAWWWLARHRRDMQNHSGARRRWWPRRREFDYLQGCNFSVARQHLLIGNCFSEGLRIGASRGVR